MVESLTQAPHSKGGKLFLVRGNSGSQKAWYYVLIARLKLPLYYKAVASGTLDLQSFGKIICSGFGENPPEDLHRELEEKYE